MGSKLIELWNLDRDHFGIILLRGTGYVWTNQVGGTSCLHPRAEGIYIPLPITWFPEVGDPLCDVVSDYDTNLVEEFLGKSKQLKKCFAPVGEYKTVLEIMEEDKLLLAEAWIPVQIIGNDEPIAPFMIGDHGILTYLNSD